MTTTLAALPTFPLAVSSNKRYLVDQNGTPFLIHGDSPWEITWKLTQQEQIEYIEKARQMKFTTLLLDVVPWTGWDGRPHTYPNRYGELPFEIRNDGYPDLSRPRSDYFGRIRWLVDQMHKRGMLAMLCICDIGSWYHNMMANTTQQCYSYALFLGNLLADCPNVLWWQGGDMDPGDAYQRVEAMANGIIASRHPSKLQTYHAGARPSSELYPNTPWCTIHNTYRYNCGMVYDDAYHDYFEHPGKPTFLSESGYEGESNDDCGGEPHRMRRQAWWTMLAGSCGHLYGSINWDVPGNWREVQNWPGARHMKVLAEFLESIPWWRLVPDRGTGLIVSGSQSGLTFANAACADDGSVLVAYVPSSRTLTINMSKLRGRANGAWLDPTTGRRQAIEGSPFDNAGTRQFRTPGNNAAGDGDWALVVETATASRRVPAGAEAAGNATRQAGAAEEHDLRGRRLAHESRAHNGAGIVLIANDRCVRAEARLRAR